MTDPFGILTAHVGGQVRVHVYDGPAQSSSSSSAITPTAALTAAGGAPCSADTVLSGTLVCLDDFGNIVLKDWVCTSSSRANNTQSMTDEAQQAKDARHVKRPRGLTVAERVLPTSGTLRFIRGSQLTSIGLM